MPIRSKYEVLRFPTISHGALRCVQQVTAQLTLHYRDSLSTAPPMPAVSVREQQDESEGVAGGIAPRPTLVTPAHGYGGGEREAGEEDERARRRRRAQEEARKEPCAHCGGRFVRIGRHLKEKTSLGRVCAV